MVSGVLFHKCRVVHPHLKLIGSAETQTEPETNSWPTVNAARNSVERRHLALFAMASATALGPPTAA